MARITEEEYQQLRRNLGLTPQEEQPQKKKNKYNAQKVHLDGYTFHSKWEGACYSILKWQFLGGLITSPLLQVPFSLGKHYGRERCWIADFVYLELPLGELVVADAKGHETEVYKQKKRVFEELYGIKIRELKRLNIRPR